MFKDFWHHVKEYRYDPFFVDEDGNSLHESNISCWIKSIWWALTDCFK